MFKGSWLDVQQQKCWNISFWNHTSTRAKYALRWHSFVKALGVSGYVLMLQFAQHFSCCVSYASWQCCQFCWALDVELNSSWLDFSFCPDLLKEGNKNVQAVGETLFFQHLSLKLPHIAVLLPKTRQLIPSALLIPSSFPVAHTNTALPASPVRNGRVGLLAGLGQLCLIILKGLARECCLCLTYLCFFLLLLSMNKEGAVPPQNCMFPSLSHAPVLSCYHWLICTFYKHI